jgi:Ran GTPase-activating protein (RanGAP) involved in mRNA processing and transport
MAAQPSLSTDSIISGTNIPRWLEEQCFRLQDEGSNLRNLNLNIRRFTPTMILALSKALEGNTRIEIVNMTSSLSNAAVAEHRHNNKQLLLPLAHAIQCHVSLKILHLSYNRLSNATPLGVSLEMNQSSLVELHLDHNSLGADTARALARALTRNSRLKVLQLNSNQVLDEGGHDLAKALKDNSSLKTLGLARNQLGEGTARELLDALRSKNVSLTRLFLEENSHVPTALAAQCLFLLKANKCGRYLLQETRNVQDSAVGSRGKASGSSPPSPAGGYRCSLWPLVLEDLEPSLIFFFLTEKPSLVPSHSTNRINSVPRSRPAT